MTMDYGPDWLPAPQRAPRRRRRNGLRRAMITAVVVYAVIWAVCSLALRVIAPDDVLPLHLRFPVEHVTAPRPAATATP